MAQNVEVVEPRGTLGCLCSRLDTPLTRSDDEHSTL